METKLRYNDALLELQSIVEEIESETVQVDEMALKVKRAAELIEFCQASLRSAEGDVKKILAKMEG